MRAIADGVPGVAGTVSTYESDSMGGVLAAAPSALTVRLYGADYGELARLGRQVEAAMTRIGGLGPPRMQLPARQPTLDLAVNLAAATRNGVKPGDIRREAATLLSGLTVGARAPCHPLRRMGAHRHGGGAGRADRLPRHLRPGRAADGPDGPRGTARCAQRGADPAGRAAGRRPDRRGRGGGPRWTAATA